MTTAQHEVFIGLKNENCYLVGEELSFGGGGGGNKNLMWGETNEAGGSRRGKKANFWLVGGETPSIPQ